MRFYRPNYNYRPIELSLHEDTPLIGSWLIVINANPFDPSNEGTCGTWEKFYPIRKWDYVSHQSFHSPSPPPPLPPVWSISVNYSLISALSVSASLLLGYPVGKRDRGNLDVHVEGILPALIRTNICTIESNVTCKMFDEWIINEKWIRKYNIKLSKFNS